MAIKGKSRSKAKGKQVSRAPRREPVHVKPPFFTRRWVQITIAAVGGAVVVLLAFWVIRGIHADRATSASQADAAKRVAAARKWETVLGGALTPIATQGQTGAPPTLFVNLGPVVASLAGGKAPKGATTTIKQVSDGVTTATGALAKSTVAATLQNQGFTAAQINSFIAAQDLIDQSLTLFGKTADSAKLALSAKGTTMKQLAGAALAEQESATALFQKGWSAFVEALLEAGVNGASGSSAGAGAPSP